MRDDIETRASFEKWYSDNWEWSKTVERDGRGGYRYAGAATAWPIWKAASERADRAQWQPIETAPKDGTRLLLANTTGKLADGVWSTRYEVWSWAYMMTEPTHWMPLPAKPD